MLSYIARRIAIALVVLLGIAIITFLMIHLIPGNPAVIVLGGHATPKAVAALEHELGVAEVEHIRDQHLARGARGLAGHIGGLEGGDAGAERCHCGEIRQKPGLSALLQGGGEAGRDLEGRPGPEPAGSAARSGTLRRLLRVGGPDRLGEDRVAGIEPEIRAADRGYEPGTGRELGPGLLQVAAKEARVTRGGEGGDADRRRLREQALGQPLLGLAELVFADPVADREDVRKLASQPGRVKRTEKEEQQRVVELVVLWYEDRQDAVQFRSQEGKRLDVEHGFVRVTLGVVHAARHARLAHLRGRQAEAFGPGPEIRSADHVAAQGCHPDARAVEAPLAQCVNLVGGRDLVRGEGLRLQGAAAAMRGPRAG